MTKPQTILDHSSGLFVMHVALGGCLHSGTIDYGITEDTGGHIGYVMGAARAQAGKAEFRRVEVVTRAFANPDLGGVHAQELEPFHQKGAIRRIWSTNRDYLEKTALEGEMEALEYSFLRMLRCIDRPDVIHAHFSDAAILAKAAERVFGIPWVYTAHSLGLDKSGHQSRSRLSRERAAITSAHAIIASSRDEAERQIMAYCQSAAGRTHRVNPGVTLPADPGTTRAKALIAPYLFAPEKPIVLAIARPVEKKNLTGLIDAYAASDNLRKRCNLVILAGQHDRLGVQNTETCKVLTQMKARVAQHGLDGSVALPPRHTAIDVRSLYSLAAQSGVFVNPAFVEPFGLTILEALTAKCPVVATKRGGPSDILKQAGYGVTVDPYNKGEIAAACLSLVDDPQRDRRCFRAHQRTQDVFDWSKWAERSNEIYRKFFRPRVPSRVISRLIASDIDATLTGDQIAADALFAFLRSMPELGCVMATGRSLPEARRVLSKWGIPETETMVTSVGSEVWDHIGAGRYRLDTEYAVHITKGWQPSDVNKVACDIGLTRQPSYDQRAWKVSFSGTALEAAQLRNALERSGLRANVIASHGRFIDVLPERANKAEAVRHVAARFGLDLSDCIACGDSANDLDMLDACGAAVLPSNALPETRALDGPKTYRSHLAHAKGVHDGIAWHLATERPISVAAE